jgi:hypothetical protein
MQGPFKRVGICGIELNEAIEKDEVEIEDLTGYYYDAAEDRKTSPFVAFVDHFYKLKETTEHKPSRSMYKLILNSLYGKFIQTREKFVEEPNGSTRVINTPAEMFHPLIASCITALTRAYIHDIEHTFEAIHTATDGVFVPNTPDLREKLEAFNARRGVSKGLGSLVYEISGDLLLVRNKTYILYSDKPYKLRGDTEEERLLEAHRQRSLSYPGLYRVKEAKHGFQGTYTQLEQLMGTGVRKYSFEHVNKIKESYKRGLVLNKFVKRDGILRVPRLQEQYKKSKSKLWKK